jgi:hypothetical protein
VGNFIMNTLKSRGPGPDPEEHGENCRMHRNTELSCPVGQETAGPVHGATRNLNCTELVKEGMWDSLKCTASA